MASRRSSTPTRAASLPRPSLPSRCSPAASRSRWTASGRALDNVFVERLWRTVKYDEIYLKSYRSQIEAHTNLDTFFRFYNEHRPHSAFGDAPTDDPDGSLPRSPSRLPSTNEPHSTPIRRAACLRQALSLLSSDRPRHPSTALVSHNLISSIRCLTDGVHLTMSHVNLFKRSQWPDLFRIQGFSVMEQRWLVFCMQFLICRDRVSIGLNEGAR